MWQVGLATVEVREVHPTSTIGRLHGTDNVVTIESDLFKKDQELVLRGPVSVCVRARVCVTLQHPHGAILFCPGWSQST